MSLQKILKLAIVSTLPLLFLSCLHVKRNGCVSLYQDWYWTTDITNESSFTKIQNYKELYHLDQKLEDKKGIIFLINDFELPENFDCSNASFYLGRARLADRVYLNTNYIGGGGNFPPDIFTAGYGARSYQITDNLLKPDRVNRIIVELYIEGPGGMYSEPCIGPSKRIEQIKERENFYYSRINEIFSFFMFFIAIFYFFQFLARPNEKENLYYALINFFSSFFLLPFFISEIPSIDQNVISLLRFNQTFVVSAALITCYFATSYIRQFIHEPTTENIIIIRLALLIVPIAVLYSIPDYFTYSRALFFFFVFVGIQIMFAVVPAVAGIISGNVQAKPLFIAFYPVTFTAFADIFFHVILGDSSKPIFSIFGWQVTTLSNLAILSYRLNALHNEIEKLNVSLEKEVQERTRELIRTNQQLEIQIKRNNDDMDYALNIQRNFFPKELPSFEKWELGYHLQPVSGVSGDFFDFFIEKGSLNGLVLFDVSGHGLGAGLVTMLCKSIIEDKFTMTLPLDLVLMNMHYAIVTRKGDIENYLVGSLIRINPDDTCEITGAGNQPPLLIHSVIQETEELVPPEGTLQYGLIGFSGLDVSFAVNTFSMHPGDFLVLYTDGITEATDPHGIPFGREMISKVASQAAFNNPQATAQELTDAIIRALHRFTLDAPFEDDVTILVLKRRN